jgi:hypothetical protein
MPKRLAITIAGAVSLGSYEAGVLYEVITAIGVHNRATQDPEQQIKIDVLTGASAGGMTAAIAAQKLMFDAAALAGVDQNALYMPWVNDVDITPLLAMAGDEPPDFSLLSSNFVEDVSRRYLTARYLVPSPVRAAPHEACAERLRLGLALSNLNGVSYRLPTRPVGSFVYRRFQDDMRFRIDGPDSDREELWEAVRGAAVACGAFPFAFRVQELSRQISEFPPTNLVRPSSGDNAPFAQTDGGVFQNEPLGIAKDLVDELDDHQDQEERFYLFISPGGRGFAKPNDFSAHNANFIRTAGQLVTAIFEQSQFHDWIFAETVNARIDLFDSVALRLHGALLKKTVGADAIAPLTEAVIPQLYTTSSADAARERLRQQFSAEYTQLAEAYGDGVAGRSSTAERWIDAIMLLEGSAGVGDRDHMRIYGITASHDELAGTQLHAFQGFFDRTYRQHDYDVGRQKARELIAALKANNDPLGPIQYATADQAPITIDETLNGLTMDKVDPDRRRRLRKRIHDRLHDAMKEAGVNALGREGVDIVFLNHFLDELFQL